MKMPGHFSVMKEHPASFEIHDARDNSSFHIAKQHLDPGSYASLQKVKKFADGGDVQKPDPKSNQPQPTSPQLDPSKVADAQTSLRNAFHFDQGTPKGGVPDVVLTPDDIKDDRASDTPTVNVTSNDVKGVFDPSKIDPSKIGAENISQPQNISPEIDAAYQKQQADKAAANAPADFSNVSGSLFPNFKGASNADPQAESADGDQSVAPASAQGATQDGVQPASMRVSSNIAPTASGPDQDAEPASPPPQPAQPPKPAPGSVDDYQQRMQASLDDLNSPNGSYAKLAQAVADNKIDPNKYWDNHSKVAATIGIILGGYAQGLGHTSTNQALAVVQDGIKRSIDAQEKNKETDMDLLKLNQGNKLQTMNQLYTMAQMTIQKQAQQTQSTQAKLQGQLLVQQIQQLKTQNALKDGAMKFLNDPSAQQGGQQQGPINNARWAALKNAGVMGGTDDTEATKEAQMYTNHLKQSQVVNQAFADASKQNTIAGRALHLGSEPASVGALQSALMPYLKDAEGRINETELARTDKFIPQPGDQPAKVAYKQQALNQFLEEKSATPTLDRLGLINRGFSSQPMVTRTMGGVPYKKVAGGWQRVSPVSATASR